MKEAEEKKEVIVVTGSSGTIGTALVNILLKEGFTVVAQSRELARLDVFKDRKNLIKLESDLNDISKTKTLLADIAKNHGQIKGLVCLAGFDKLSPLSFSDTDSLEQLLKIHAVAPFALVSSITKRAISVEGASVVLISSLATKQGAKGHSAYAMAKGALEGFLRTAASELASRKIRINLVTPGVIEGEMSNAWISKLSGKQKERLEKSYPLGFGSGDDVANLISFLLSDKAKWITGQEIIVDGGRLIFSE